MTSSDWTTEDTDSFLAPDEIIFEYHDHFDFEDFLEKVTPLVAEIINGECEEDDTPTFEFDLNYDICPADYSYEIREMFERMGLDKWDGHDGLNVRIPMTYINVVIVRDDGDELIYDRYPVGVDGYITITNRPMAGEGGI